MAPSTVHSKSAVETRRGFMVAHVVVKVLEFSELVVERAQWLDPL